MRDINRIKPFCKRLEKMWESVPDWRFGQLISNFFGDILAEEGSVDIFFMEDDKMLEHLKKFNYLDKRIEDDEYTEFNEDECINSNEQKTCPLNVQISIDGYDGKKLRTVHIENIDLEFEEPDVFTVTRYDENGKLKEIRTEKEIGYEQ